MADEEPAGLRVVYLTAYRGQVRTAALALETAIWAAEQAQQYAIRATREFPLRGDIARDLERITETLAQLRQVRRILHDVHGA